jgi:hypothetical protein
LSSQGHKTYRIENSCYQASFYKLECNNIEDATVITITRT